MKMNPKPEKKNCFQTSKLNLFVLHVINCYSYPFLTKIVKYILSIRLAEVFVLLPSNYPALDV